MRKNSTASVFPSQKKETCCSCEKYSPLIYISLKVVLSVTEISLDLTNALVSGKPIAV